MPTPSRSEITHSAIEGAPWLALLKFTYGDWNVSPAEREALLARGLIEIKGGSSVLTPRGREALGLDAPSK
jgi:hypothetical protein